MSDLIMKSWRHDLKHYQSCYRSKNTMGKRCTLLHGDTQGQNGKYFLDKIGDTSYIK